MPTSILIDQRRDLLSLGSSEGRRQSLPEVTSRRPAVSPSRCSRRALAYMASPRPAPAWKPHNLRHMIHQRTTTEFNFMAERVTLRKRNPYNTKSARRQIIKTPGGHLRYLHVTKRGSVPKCGDCHSDLSGIKAHRPREFGTISKRQKTVSRAYGGSRCSGCVRTRIIRAFLVEEAKIVKHVLKSQAKAK
ncbi:hypothetical protein NDA10_003592 [Ustilago hordei]|nr:hypothetical protein NDA10_003592 [Ustilago hordei]